jgi:predicted dehydrogenase
MRGNQLVNNIPDEGRIVAICDADERKTAQALKNHQADWRVAKDYRALLDQADIDAVMIATTDHHHVQAGVLACMAGKDVYVEKPLSLYIKEGRTLVSAARKYQRVVQTGTQQRSMEMNKFACELVRDGGIGKVRVVECVNYSSPKHYQPGQLPRMNVPPGMDWDLWQGQAPARPYHDQLASHWTDESPNWWGSWWAYSGRQMTGLGAHAFDMVQYALGADDTGPVEFWPVEEGAEARIHFRYASGVEVRLRFPDQRPYRGPRLGGIFSGSACKIEINRNKFTTNPPDFVKHPPDPELAGKWEGDGWLAHGHVQNWIDCIKSRQRPVADVEIGHRTATVCHLCSITRQLGRRLKWDPASEQFPNDPEANMLVDRERRAGWELPVV